ncbi:MAG: hypothetical protein ACJASY_001920, partial [Halioglobus sp.]
MLPVLINSRDECGSNSPYLARLYMRLKGIH